VQAQVRRGGSLYALVNHVPNLFANYLLAYVGIVPVLSLLKQHVRQMLQFSPNLYLEGLEYREENIQNVELAMEERKGSLVTKVAGTSVSNWFSVSSCGVHFDIFGRGIHKRSIPIERSSSRFENPNNDVTFRDLVLPGACGYSSRVINRSKKERRSTY
jgi:hypothetical protein